MWTVPTFRTHWSFRTHPFFVRYSRDLASKIVLFMGESYSRTSENRAPNTRSNPIQMRFVHISLILRCNFVVVVVFLSRSDNLLNVHSHSLIYVRQTKLTWICSVRWFSSQAIRHLAIAPELNCAHCTLYIQHEEYIRFETGNEKSKY